MTPAPTDLARVHAAAFPDRRVWAAEEFSALIKMRGVILCGDARSFLLGRIILDEAEVITLATDPGFLRQGRAAHALRQFLIQAAKQGAQSAFLEVADDNDPAKALYHKEGFIQVGQRPDYYTTNDGLKVGACLMRKALNKCTISDAAQ